MSTRFYLPNPDGDADWAHTDIVHRQYVTPPFDIVDLPLWNVEFPEDDRELISDVPVAMPLTVQADQELVGMAGCDASGKLEVKEWRLRTYKPREQI